MTPNSNDGSRWPAPQSPPACLTIAGSDSGGGAGIQADLKAMEAAGAFGTSAITAVTAQHTRGVERSHVLPVDLIEAQIDAVRGDIDLDAVKTGMLGTADVVDLVARMALELSAPLVVDPVMVAASGDRLLDEDAEEAYPALVETARVVTPNVPEAEVLTGETIETPADAERAGQALCEVGADAALVKGGHLDGPAVTDVLVTEGGTRRFRHPRVDTDATHGSGCMLASTIAARLAHGDPIEEAVATSLARMDRAVRYPLDVGGGPGAVHHLAEIRNDAAVAETIEAVRGLVEALVTADVAPLVPEVGMNVVGVTPLAEDRSDSAAVDGRITRTSMGVRHNGGIAIAASSHVARFVLAIREHDHRIRFGINCRFDERIETALGKTTLTVGEYDRDSQPESVARADGSTMAWAAGVVCEDRDGAPAAIIDRGAHGKEPILKLLAPDAGALRDRTLALADALGAVD